MSTDRETYIQKKQELEEQLKANAKVWIAEVIKEALIKLGALDITGLRWRQYTPYFNDGEPCVFWCLVDDYEVEIAGEWLDSYELDTRVRDALPRLSSRQVGGDEVFLSAFGDHARVEARLAEGGVAFTVEEYDHD